MSQRLLSRIDEKDRKAFEDIFKLESTKLVRQTVIELIEELLNRNIKTSEMKNKYDLQNWGLSHADDIGYRRALREIKTIFE